MKKRTKILLLGIETVLALLAAVSFFFGFQLLAADFMDFSHLYRLLPAILSYSSFTYCLFVLHSIFKNEKSQNRRRIAFGNGIALVSIETILLIWEIVYSAIGLYPMDGMLTAVFPLDVIAISIISLCLGILLILYWHKTPKEKDEPKEKKPVGKKILHGFSRFFFGFFTLIALYELGGLLLGFGFASYDSPLFEVGIPAYIAMLLPSVFLLLRDVQWLFPLPAKKGRLTLSIASLSLGIVFASLPLFLLIPYPTYVEACFHPYYPLDFMGSLRLSLYFWSIPNILAPFFFFLLPSLKVLSSAKEEK